MLRSRLTETRSAPGLTPNAKAAFSSLSGHFHRQCARPLSRPAANPSPSRATSETESTFPAQSPPFGRRLAPRQGARAGHPSALPARRPPLIAYRISVLYTICRAAFLSFRRCWREMRAARRACSPQNRAEGVTAAPRSMGDGERSGKTARKGHGSRAGRCASGGFERLAEEKPDDFLEIEFVGLVKCLEPVAVDIEDKLRRTPRNERHD